MAYFKEDIYHRAKQTYCEECVIAIASPYVRKTHWQCIQSVKADYLKPEKKKLK